MQEILSNLVAEQQFLDQYLQSIPIRNWSLKTSYKNWDITAHVSYLAAIEDLTFNALKKNGSDFNKFKGPKGLEKFEKEAIKKGTTIHTSDGIIKYLTRFISLTLLPIHNIVVVMSPIGDQAPPALAAIIIKPAYHSFKLLSFTNF